ncbi:DeoR/GlpR family DNA-binding transcription regulator [Anaerostipes sp.]|uniref:DeoR/GlpR family DNA-binding transcription regulator n=1 Tax=Anaerostipes sp. TaxID=1872530 RepID=UPI0025BBAFA7|nr:DeoR/GlpR family DNA-binding transcription regulator [Anaerostipes sp.]MBS7009604.1 DeoR/GlpR transcriptional regulator [Anaerostipes sp.]
MAKKEQRLNKLLSYIKTYEYVPIPQLMNEFNVSKSTIIRDLADLDEQHLIERIHGGARALSDDRITKFNIREKVNEKEKASIVRSAAEQVKDNDTIYLDTGSTCFLLYKEITAKNITVFTPNLAIIHYGPRSNVTHIYALEGEVSTSNYSLTGNLTLENMKRIYPEKIFFSALGLHNHHNHEIQCANEIQMSTIRIICEMEGYKVLILDSSKIGLHKAFQGNSIRDIDLLITDSKISSEDAESIRNNAKELLIADV